MIKPIFLVFLSLPFWGCTPQAKPDDKTPSPPGPSVTSSVTTNILSNVEDQIPIPPQTPCDKIYTHTGDDLLDICLEYDGTEGFACSKDIKHVQKQLFGKWQYIGSWEGSSNNHEWYWRTALLSTTLEFTEDFSLIITTNTSEFINPFSFIPERRAVRIQTENPKFEYLIFFFFTENRKTLITWNCFPNCDEVCVDKYQRIIP